MSVQNAETTHSPDASLSLLNLRIISLFLVFVGIIVTGYLSYVKMADKETICIEGANFNCDVVQNSRYAQIMGIPTAYLGFATYLAIGGLLLVENQGQFFRENSIFMLFGLVLFAFIYSMYLVYIQGAVLEAWCQWCLAHEGTMTVLFVVTVLRLKQALIETPK
jgi:uncharacterized membrane protein